VRIVRSGRRSFHVSGSHFTTLFTLGQQLVKFTSFIAASYIFIQSKNTLSHQNKSNVMPRVYSHCAQLQLWFTNKLLFYHSVLPYISQQRHVLSSQQSSVRSLRSLRTRVYTPPKQISIYKMDRSFVQEDHICFNAQLVCFL
jgi:hypothetical protein